MRRTSTLHAAGAALGLLAGLAMTHRTDSVPLGGEVAPYAVAVAWRSPGPSPEMPVAGVQADDWGGRLPPPPPAKPAPARERARPRAPEVRRAPKGLATEGQPARAAKQAPAPRVLRGAEMAAATFGVRREECPRERLARLAVEAARAASSKS